MVLREWDRLPAFMQVKEVKPYYNVLHKKKNALRLKRIFDIVVSVVMGMLLLPVFAVLAILITVDSRGGIFYRQERVTQYGRIFKILKFRTMTADADKTGPQITVGKDSRITRIGGFLRRYRLDELPQLFNILMGDMTFVGTRPEVPKYVKRYTPEMRATLLLPAGVTSRASIHYKEEALLLDKAEDADDVYRKQILPAKMEYNLKSLKQFGLWEELKVMVLTVLAVLGREEQERSGERRETDRKKSSKI